MSTKKVVLVCGATGFIGRNIVESFAQNENYEVIGVHNKRSTFECINLRWVKADLTKVEDIRRVIKGVDIIIQAAATTSGSKDIVARPYIHVTDNAVMNSLLFREAFDNKVKHVIFFSCTVMLQSIEKPQDEDAYDANLELHPRYFGVGNTKLYIEKMCDFYSRIGETKFTAIRHTNIYGPYDKFDLQKSHVFGATITKVMRARKNIIIWGEGSETRDLLHINDLMDFVNSAIKKQKKQFDIFNVGSSKNISIKNLAKKIIKHSGKKINLEFDLSKKSLKNSVKINISKSKKEIGWTPKINIDSGIKKTLVWYKDIYR